MRLGVYDRLYPALCGEPPATVRPLHVKWLPNVDLRRDLSRLLPGLEGRVLDVGCGTQPYRPLLASVSGYVGIDLEEGEGIDRVVVPGRPWPFGDAEFDAVLCTQVLEHATDDEQLLAEIERVLRPGGTLVVSVPFIYNAHSMPHDYRRWSAPGLERWLGRRFEVTEVRKQGRVGTLLGLLWLNWLNDTVQRHRVLAIARVLLLPLWIVHAAAVNGAARLLDRLDGVGAHYTNVLAVARRRA